jgi:uridine phosphorylase
MFVVATCANVSVRHIAGKTVASADVFWKSQDENLLISGKIQITKGAVSTAAIRATYLSNRLEGESARRFTARIMQSTLFVLPNQKRFIIVGSDAFFGRGETVEWSGVVCVPKAR